MRPAAGDPLLVLRRWLIGAVAVSFALAALVLIARRLSGALVDPLPAATLLVAGCAVAIGAWSIRESLRNLAGQPHAPVAEWALRFAPSALALVLALVLSIPGTSAAGLIAIWAVVVAAEGWNAYRHWLERSTARRPRGALPDSRNEAARSEPLALADAPDREPELPGEQVIQQLVRRREADGTEALSGWVRAQFAPRQRTATAHVAFCPPFVTLPECHVEPVDGPPVRIKLGQVLPYGVRFDLKLEPASECPTSVLFEFSAREKPAADRAASG